MSTLNNSAEHPSLQLERVFNPETVAVIGASKDTSKRGNQTIKDLQESGYDGEIYPVNPKYDSEIRGLTVYDSVAATPGTIDLAFIATPAETIPDIVEECGDAGAAGAVVIAAGFSEAGEEGLEAAIRDTARDCGVALIGPNIQGIYNLHTGLNLLGGYEMPKGNIALLAQSGNIGLEFGSHAEGRNSTGFSFNIGVGNETDLEFHDYLEFLDDDEHTDAIALYVDGMSDGRAFLQTAREVVQTTPIVVLKGGLTEEGKQSVQSHTASLAGDSDVLDAAYEQAGVIQVNRSDHVVPVADALAKLPPAAGDNVAILTDGGGNATLAADSLSNRGLSVTALSESTRERLRELVPDAPNVTNPVDMMGLQGDGDLSIFYDCAEALVADPAVDSLLLTGVFGAYESRGPGDGDTGQEPDVARRIASLVEEYDTSIAVHCIYGTQGSPALDALEEAGVPTYGSLDVAIASLEKLSQYGAHLSTADTKSTFQLGGGHEQHSLVRDALDAGKRQLSEFHSKQLLDAEGLPVAPFDLVTTAAEAADAAAEYEGPVAMKAVSDDIVHKTEADCVALDVDTEAAVRENFTTLVDNAKSYDPNCVVDGVLVSPMLDPAVELIVGVLRDEEVGSVLMFGVGGIFVEVMRDVAFRALPLTEHDARSLVNEIDAQELLDGVRGNAGIDREALVDLLVDVSEIATANPSITELDLNPVFASPDGTVIADASIILDTDE
ncbi:acetate--CoA ligase family protein [Natrinema sp. HArc-T2]|uniref:acetate--CoA ligase family protein n=1 Tax=Natrinema sp. HArc-T2 TaxID=3242701 RepID=UPI00359EBD94